MGRMDKNKRSNYMLSNEDSVEMKRDVQVESERMENIFHANCNQKRWLY